MIHPSAVVHSAAELASDLEIGPFCTVGAGVRLGRGCRLESHVVLTGETTIGEDNRFFPFSVVGGIPQDLKFKGEKSRLEIGRGNTFRESMTVHAGTRGGGGVTRIGDGGFFMAYVHIAHDCQIGNGVIMANGATLAGHVTVQDAAAVGAFSGVHQFCRVGVEAFIGGYSVVTRDALPYVLTVGNRATSHGINVVGLKRRQRSEAVILALKRAYRTLFRCRLPRAEALRLTLQGEGDCDEVRLLVDFIKSSERGVVV